MPEESSDDTKWLVEPPGPGQVAVHVALGEGVELDETQRAALDSLLASLQQSDAEVAGFEASKCIITACKPKEITTPCRMYIGSCSEYSSCQIAQVGRFY